MEYLLIVNRFIPKSATRLIAGKAAHCDRHAFYVFIFLKSERSHFTLIPPLGSRGFGGISTYIT